MHGCQKLEMLSQSILTRSKFRVTSNLFRQQNAVRCNTVTANENVFDFTIIPRFACQKMVYQSRNKQFYIKETLIMEVNMAVYFEGLKAGM